VLKFAETLICLFKCVIHKTYTLLCTRIWHTFRDSDLFKWFLLSLSYNTFLQYIFAVQTIFACNIANILFQFKCILYDMYLRMLKQQLYQVILRSSKPTFFSQQMFYSIKHVNSHLFEMVIIVNNFMYIVFSNSESDCMCIYVCVNIF
jgi:hypothetical protein